MRCGSQIEFLDTALRVLPLISIHVRSAAMDQDQLSQVYHNLISSNEGRLRTARSVVRLDRVPSSPLPAGDVILFVWGPAHARHNVLSSHLHLQAPATPHFGAGRVGGVRICCIEATACGISHESLHCACISARHNLIFCSTHLCRSRASRLNVQRGCDAVKSKRLAPRLLFVYAEITGCVTLQ